MIVVADNGCGGAAIGAERKPGSFEWGCRRALVSAALGRAAVQSIDGAAIGTARLAGGGGIEELDVEVRVAMSQAQE